MTALVQAALRVRRTARSAWGLGAACLLGAFLFAGFFTTAERSIGWEHAAWALAWVALLSQRAFVARRLGTDSRSSFELGVILLVGVFALVQLRGGIDSPINPLSYVAVALVASFASGWAGWALIAVSVALALGTAVFGEGIRDPWTLGLNVFFLGAFGALSHAFTRVEIARVRRESALQLAAQQEKVRDDMRLFRLVAPSSDGVRDEERL